MSTRSDSRQPHPDDPLPSVGPRDRRHLLTGVLRRVSRAFYLTLRVLPRALRTPIGLAYLLARAADTIADARAATPTRRLVALRRFRSMLARPAGAEDARALSALAARFAASDAERTLADSLLVQLSLLESLPREDAARVRSVVTTLTRGMEVDLTSFPGEAAGAPGAFRIFDDLDRYTYLVAGCVGEFWTEASVAKTPALSGWDVRCMSDLGVGFGKALQLTNVLRDVPADLRAGRCYLPADWLAAEGLRPADLLDPDERGRGTARARARHPRRPGTLPRRGGLRPRRPAPVRAPPARGAVARPDGTRHTGPARQQRPLARPVLPLQGHPRVGLPHHGPLGAVRRLRQRPPPLVPPPPRPGRTHPLGPVGPFPPQERA